jgi:phage terminase small subunit
MTPKQRRFVEEYLVDLNAAAAARRAGYSEKYGRQRAWRALRNPEVRGAVEAAMRERIGRTTISFERVIDELARLAFASSGEYFDWGSGGVTLKDKTVLTLDQQAAVAEIHYSRTRSGNTVRFKLCDKLGALKELSRLLGFNAETPGAGRAGDAETAELSETERVQRVLALLARARARRQADESGTADDR